MPQFVLKTNVSKCKIPKDFWPKVTEIVASMLDKPAHATMVRGYRRLETLNLEIKIEKKFKKILTL